MIWIASPMELDHEPDWLAYYSHETHLVYISDRMIDHGLGFFTILNHEIMHKILHERVSASASIMYDDIAALGQLDKVMHGGHLDQRTRWMAIE